MVPITKVSQSSLLFLLSRPVLLLLRVGRKQERSTVQHAAGKAFSHWPCLRPAGVRGKEPPEL